MILGDLLGRAVHDSDGVKLGRVADARFVVDGAPQQLMAEARLLGLVVSPHSVSSFLGYERTGVTQPWPLPRMLRWRHRGSFLVMWEDIAVMGESVRLREGFTAYSPELVGGPE
ncbi:sporulation protein YlmC with PRC-barrel domain [Arthrobacter pascens]|uniref:PRC-barrel domain-containing protein n=1 Tax=Arthrobacter pascens TaxID=1677 RepID=UPI00277FEC83|nr:PRC-barrel domain containing protein [Arthrobacter pascens]MDQ0635007.1 sporulation protein YlmC with PRC-barrel domain [Arthrobacter pascens]